VVAATYLNFLLLSEINSVSLLEVLSEGGSINLNDAVLYQSVGTNQLVVRGIVVDVQQTSLASHS
jgi:hypothetical protein